MSIAPNAKLELAAGRSHCYCGAIAQPNGFCADHDYEAKVRAHNLAEDRKNALRLSRVRKMLARGTETPRMYSTFEN